MAMVKETEYIMHKSIERLLEALKLPYEQFENSMLALTENGYSRKNFENENFIKLM